MESWFFISIIGYLLLALEAVFSKALLTSKVKDWRIYSFYVGLFSLSGLMFAPFGLEWFGWLLMVQSLIAGLIFYLALIFLYKSLQGSSASRVFVLYGVITTLVSFLWEHFGGITKFGDNDFIGVLLLIIGGILISYKVHENRLFSNYKNVVFSGLLMGVALIILKISFDQQNFVTGYVFSRVGVFLSAMLLFVFPEFRKVFGKDFSKRDQKRNQVNLFLVVSNKTLAGIGTILVNYSISLGSVALITALVSVQYLFTFIFATLASFFVAKIIKEKMTLRNIVFKFFGVVLIILGIFLINF